jgi:hypothetical protein
MGCDEAVDTPTCLTPFVGSNPDIPAGLLLIRRDRGRTLLLGILRRLFHGLCLQVLLSRSPLGRRDGTSGLALPATSKGVVMSLAAD